MENKLQANQRSNNQASELFKGESLIVVEKNGYSGCNLSEMRDKRPMELDSHSQGRLNKNRGLRRVVKIRPPTMELDSRSLERSRREDTVSITPTEKVGSLQTQTLYSLDKLRDILKVEAGSWPPESHDHFMLERSGIG